MVPARQICLEIAVDGVNSLDLGNIFRFALGHTRRLINTSCLADGPETSQAVGEDRTVRNKMVLCQQRNSLELKARDGRQLYAQRAAVVAHRYGCDKRHLVLRATTDLVAAAFHVEIGIIVSDFDFKHVAIFALGHHLHEFAVDQPLCGLTHAQLPLQIQGRQLNVSLDDQVDCQELDRQWQLGALKYGSGNQRGLMLTGVALKDFAHAIPKHVMSGATTGRKIRAVRPANGFKQFSNCASVPQPLRKAGIGSIS